MEGLMLRRAPIEAQILAGSAGLHKISVCDFGNRQAGIEFLQKLLPALRALNDAVTSRGDEGGRGR